MRAFDVQAELGEGALWDWRHGLLVSVDLLSGRLLLSDPGDGTTRAIDVGQPVSAALLRAHDQLLLAVRDGFASVELTGGAVSPLVAVEADLPDNRMNDGSCDRAGRFYAGTMAADESPAAGSLYRLDPDLQLTRLFDGVGISNGIGWSPDEKRMYYVDSLAYRVDVMDYDPATGEIGPRRPLAALGHGDVVPDGLTVDAEGCIWVAVWGGGAVQRYRPDGRLKQIIKLPAAHVTSCAFGGAGLDVLYISTAAGPGTSAGALFACRPGVTGQECHPFRG